MPQQIAETLLLSDEIIRRHIEEYKFSKKLDLASGGSEEKISPLQSQKLEKHIYLYVKDIIAYVKTTWAITYTASGMSHWLKRQALHTKNPLLDQEKADLEKQKEWLVEYEKLKRSLPEDETICFTDGVHPTHNLQPAYGWIRKGKRKEIQTNSGRGRLNLSGMIDIYLSLEFISMKNN